MSKPLLEIDNLTVSYTARRRRPTQILNAVTLSLNEGETFGLVGESGSGKTTLARSILGLVAVESGEMRFAGEDITRATRIRRRQLSQDIQVVFQDPYASFNPNRTIGQSVAETLTRHAPLSRADLKSRIEQVLERVDIDPGAISRYPSHFSGGQRQRIAIARALMPSPRLVICDEALSALDLSVQAKILNLLGELQASSRFAYLFISHDLDVVRYFCDRVAVLRRGEVVETGAVSVVCSTPSHPYTRHLLAAAPVADPEIQRQRREHRHQLERVNTRWASSTTPPAASCPTASQ